MKQILIKRNNKYLQWEILSFKKILARMPNQL